MEASRRNKAYFYIQNMAVSRRKEAYFSLKTPACLHMTWFGILDTECCRALYIKSCNYKNMLGSGMLNKDAKMWALISTGDCGWAWGGHTMPVLKQCQRERRISSGRGRRRQWVGWRQQQQDLQLRKSFSPCPSPFHRCVQGN